MADKRNRPTNPESFYSVVEAQKPEVLQPAKYTWVSYEYLTFEEGEEESELTRRENLLSDIAKAIRHDAFFTATVETGDQIREAFESAEEIDAQIVVLYRIDDSHKVYLRSDLVIWLLEWETGRKYTDLKLYRTRVLLNGRYVVEHKPYREYYQPYFQVPNGPFSRSEANMIRSNAEKDNKRAFGIGYDLPIPTCVDQVANGGTSENTFVPDGANVFKFDGVYLVKHKTRTVALFEDRGAALNFAQVYNY